MPPSRPPRKSPRALPPIAKLAESGIAGPGGDSRSPRADAEDVVPRSGPDRTRQGVRVMVTTQQIGRRFLRLTRLIGVLRSKLRRETRRIETIIITCHLRLGDHHYGCFAGCVRGVPGFARPASLFHFAAGPVQPTGDLLARNPGRLDFGSSPSTIGISIITLITAGHFGLPASDQRILSPKSHRPKRKCLPS